ncbi:LysR family transcriptional regulator [Salipiger sp. PrR002]|uniref:LysR family transcriptional regulator n=1 Tax=Salipiger sp. PrR002 TaxID=2706489 RepID=UPI0013BBC3CC|nr:LysR family transcriptional regulator [Salipiger sp. PrR002]NDW02714.1 LysR family transcriptional regulator [Salipiger sp. PrR002]NDW60008.1 LysR family transcriptional regulator [Salipiger sp. PrR004]
MKSRFRSWTDVQIFLAVFREGSTLAASRKIGMAQPTVARRIDVLEHEVGLVLFDRGNRGFRPTEAARTLLPLAEALEAAAKSFAAAAEALTRPRPIRITAVFTNFSPAVTQIFSEFTASHPAVRFEFLPTARPLDLLGGEVDIALRITRRQPEPALICRRISTARFTLFGAPSYAAKHGLPVSPDDLAGHVFVTYAPDDMPSIYHDWLAARITPGQIILAFSEYGLLEAAIRAGQGLGIMNLKLAETDESAGRLIRCFPPPDEMSAAHLMLISPEAHRRAEVREFTKFFAPRYAALFK